MGRLNNYDGQEMWRSRKGADLRIPRSRASLVREIRVQYAIEGAQVAVDSGSVAFGSAARRAKVQLREFIDALDRRARGRLENNAISLRRRTTTFGLRFSTRQGVRAWW